MTTHRLNIRAAVPAVTAAGDYAPRLAALRDQKASGVYAILDAATGAVLYVGESHTGRLYDTITRHFREWSTPSAGSGRREGGTQYRREAVKVTWRAMPAAQAQDFQYREIQRLRPADNLFDGATIENNPPRPGPLRPGVRVKVRSITYEADGTLYKHDFKANSRGTIKLPKSAIRNGWIDDR